MKNIFFQFKVSDEQLHYATKLVEYSIKNHPVSDIFCNDPGGLERQREFRLTGTLGEVLFADVYSLPRPIKSFGAINGQDYGQDFILKIDGKEYAFDIKTMRRKNNYFKNHYVLNLPKYQMIKKNTLTDYYFCISLHNININCTIASFIGYISKHEIQKGKIGILYKSGSRRIKDNKCSFIFQRDTYEIYFKDLSPPFMSDKLKKLPLFEIKTIN